MLLVQLAFILRQRDREKEKQRNREPEKQRTRETERNREKKRQGDIETDKNKTVLQFKMLIVITF